MAGGLIQGCNSCNINYDPLQEVEKRTNANSASEDFLKDIAAVKEVAALGVDGNEAAKALAMLINHSGSTDGSIARLKAIVAARPDSGISVLEMAAVEVTFRVEFWSKLPNLSNELVRELASVATGKSDLFAAMIDAIRTNACPFSDVVAFGKTAVKVEDYLKAFNSMVGRVAAKTESKGWVAA